MLLGGFLVDRCGFWSFDALGSAFIPLIFKGEQDIIITLLSLPASGGTRTKRLRRSPPKPRWFWTTELDKTRMNFSVVKQP